MKISGYFLFFLFFLFLFGISIIIYNNRINSIIPCLEEIARDYCEEKGFYFENVYWGFDWLFHCKEDFRQVNYMMYGFSEEEIKECKIK